MKTGPKAAKRAAPLSIRGPPVGKRAAQPPPRAAFWTGAPLSRLRLSSQFRFAADLLAILPRARSPLLFVSRPISSQICVAPDPAQIIKLLMALSSAMHVFACLFWRVKLEVRARGPAAVPPSVRCAGSTASRPEPSGGAAPPSPPSTPTACLYCGVGRSVMRFVRFPTSVSPAGS